MPVIEPDFDLPKQSDVSTSNERLLSPFTIITDTAEQQPFTFQGIYADSDRANRLLLVRSGVNLIKQALGRHPHSLGDYSIEGFVGRCHIERKSMEDCWGTILAFGKGEDEGRRDRFEQELANLSNIEAGLVVVECSLQTLIDNTPATGKKTAKCNQKTLNRSIIAYTQDYSVKWLFCDSRRLAELETFRWMERFYEKHRVKRTRKAKEPNDG
jgi:hypothetical protein